MNLSIGILARNESASIGKTLESLLAQTVFENSDRYNAIEIIVVANGCTDDTAKVTRAKFEELMGESQKSQIQWKVCEITEPGKSNAWNFYVHQFSNAAADFLVLMDASHSFKAYIKPRELIKHEQRVVIGITINIFICNYLRAICNQQQNASFLIEQMNQKDPKWLKHFIEDKILTTRWWYLPLTLVFRRFRNLKNRSLSKALLFAPITIAAFVVDMLIFVLANYKLSKGTGFNYW
ncbi:MAG: glycosyltransferase [Xenococcaceae cyanobacterium]